jgi:cation-transporting ATPase 13A3/4/5
MVIRQPSALELLIKELLRPLYLFLFFSVGLWFYEMYYYYAGIILFTSSVAIIVNLIQMVQLNAKIFNMAYYEIKVNVLREGKVVEVSSLDLVPGDVVFLKKPVKIPFEGIILEGSALINECALTGESVPIVKKADLLQNYRSEKERIDKTAYVYEGTTIIQVNSKKKMALFE